MADPWAWWDAETIARVTSCPVENVREHWPIIADSLEKRGLYERDIARGVLATVAIESASTFRPVLEAFWMPQSYRDSLRYAPFIGRGYLQITWEDNYRAAGEALGIDLVGHPDRALEPQIAADVLAWFWATKGVRSKDGTRWYSLSDLCREGDWRWVRAVVQGGDDGLDRLISIATTLGGGTVPTTVAYNPDARVDQQPDDWSCSIQSTEWILRSVGRNPDDAWIQNAMMGAGLVRTDTGLQDGSGAQLAAWLTRGYGAERGWTAQSAPLVTFDDVAAGAGVNPTLIGGRRWNHWSGVRGYDAARDLLLLANPSDGWMGVGQTMSREQCDALGTFSAVYIDRMSSTTVPEPSIVLPPAKDTRVERARELMRQALAVLDEPVPV